MKCKKCNNEKRPEDVIDFNVPNCTCDRNKEREETRKAVKQYAKEKGWIKNEM